MTANRISRPWLLCVLGGFVLAGFIFMTTQPGTAQTKKKGKTDKSAKKKDQKGDPPPAEFPKRSDSIDLGAGGAEYIHLIDEHLSKGWKDNSTYPSERCTDYEFLRRASLDIIGRIPTIKEIAQFMKQPTEKRRSWLINAMLDGKEYGSGAQYAQNFANLWTVHLLTRTGSKKHHQAQMNDWLYNQLKGEGEQANPDWSKTVTELIAGAGETNRNGAVNYLLHNLGEEIKGDRTKDGHWDMVPATSRTTRLFLGIRTQCVQCHDHPFEGEWGQHHFWGINAFLRQVDSNGRPNPEGGKKKKGVMGNQEFELKDVKSFNSSGLIGYERRNTVFLFTDASFLNGKKIPKRYAGTRRDALAKFVIASPWFSKAFVNRTWGHFFGKSFTKDAVDDFGDHNPVSHPELLDKLSEDWAKKYSHNPKVLIRWICNSQAYGLSSRANKWNDKVEDETLFARMLLKPMTPEQMFESMMTATDAKLGQDKGTRLAAKEKWFDKLIVNFGNDEGEEGSFSGTVIQALLLMNGDDINKAISDPKDGAVAAIVRKRGASFAAARFAIHDLYMHTLNRPPTDKELLDMVSAKTRMWAFRKNMSPFTPIPNTPQFWTNYYQDVMWALLNCNEFILNH
ncbi:MAG: DUF1549 domain-containing protein [Planctomycetes bacterium]|nr:DUF1549 domain-containing protein [Planctomycetota bacterium]